VSPSRVAKLIPEHEPSVNKGYQLYTEHDDYG
jgi:hypothetical protein